MDPREELRRHLRPAAMVGAAIFASLVLYLTLVEVVRAFIKPFRGFAAGMPLQPFRLAAFGAAAAVILAILLLRPPVVAATLQQDEASQRILEQLMRVVPYDSASVQLLGNGYLEIVGGLGWRDPSSVLGLRFPIPGDNPNTRVVQTRKPYILGNALVHHKTFGQAPHNHIHSWMGVPLIVHDQVIGMLAIDNTQVNYFTEDQARLVSAFADQVAIVMENARLYKAAGQAAERRAVLYRISQEIVAARCDPERIYAAIHRATEHLMPAEAFALSPCMMRARMK